MSEQQQRLVIHDSIRKITWDLDGKQLDDIAALIDSLRDEFRQRKLNNEQPEYDYWYLSVDDDGDGINNVWLTGVRQETDEEFLKRMDKVEKERERRKTVYLSLKQEFEPNT